MKAGMAKERKNFGLNFPKFLSLISRLLSRVLKKKFKRFEEIGYHIISKQFDYF